MWIADTSHGVLCGVTIGSAGDQDRKRDPEQDLFCQSYCIEQKSKVMIVADQIKKRDRKKDGSCQSFTTEKMKG